MARTTLPVITRPLTDNEHGEILDSILDQAFQAKLCARNLETAHCVLDVYATRAHAEFTHGHRATVSAENLHAVTCAAYEQIDRAGCSDCDHE